MSVRTVLKPHSKDLGGGFTVNRLLPSAQQQAVGPFIFFDHFGPVAVEPGTNHDVRPHPHIGLATVTHLLEGVILHRDNLGCVQRIEPGAINWMTAGRGIVHSERKPPQQMQQRYVNHGLQLWLALPEAHEEDAASFVHTPASAIPELTADKATVRVLVGEAFGARSPVATVSPTLYLDVQLPAGAQWTLPLLAEEQAIYPLQGQVTLDGTALEPHSMAVMSDAVTLKATEGPARFAVIGGQPLGHRWIWWNFVSSRKERIEEAKRAWAQGDVNAGMGQVPGENERIALPER